MPEKKRFSLLPKKNRWIYITLILIIIGAIIYFYPRPPEPIETEKIKKEDLIESISTTGSIDSKTTLDLHFQVAGKIILLNVKKGDHITKGQIIGILDQRTVQKTLENYLRDYSIQRNSFDQTLDDNQNRTPDQALTDNMKRILQNNQYNLEKAVLSVELQDLAKQATVLTSPIDGILYDSDIDASGVYVTTSTSFKIADDKNMNFKIEIDEADVGKVKIGQMVKIYLDAYPDQELNLPVKQIDFAAHTNATGGNVYNVEVDLPENPNVKYRIGMLGDADITIREVKNALSVPLSSIDDENNVYVKTEKGFQKRKIQLGLQNDTDSEVLSGLKEGEEVALDSTEGQYRVANEK